MKVLFSPEFQGHVYLGLNEENTHLMDVMVCDTMRLIGMLEMRLGIHVDDQPSHHRVVMYFKALSEYMKSHPDNALAASFKLSNLGTAEQALRWRDSLMLDGWQPGNSAPESGRLKVLSGTEEFFDCPGMPDRLKAILQLLKNGEHRFDDIEVELPCEVDMLHPAVADLLSTLNSHGATLTIRKNCELSGSNLSRVAQLLQSTTNEKISLNKDDRSFLIYSFPDEKAANEYLALKGDELNAELWINNTNKSLDNFLRLMGKPTMGSNMDASSPQVLQLFVLGIDMMKEPLNIQSLISWLYSPKQPFGTFFGRILAEKIIEKGGYRNDSCRQLIDDYISGKYTYHDEDKDSKLTEQKIAKQKAEEEKERRTLVETYLPSLEATGDIERIETLRLKTYLNSLSTWAKKQVNFLSKKPDNEGWCNQLDCLAQMCDTFVLLMDSSSIEDYVDIKQVDSWISTLYKGESFIQYNAQRYCSELIDDPSKMASSSEHTVWINFVQGENRQLDCGFLYPTERENIKDSITLWDDDKEMGYHQLMQQLPFFLTEKQLILVTTDYCAGEPTTKHPVMVRLESQVDNLKDFIIKPNLLAEETENVELVNNTNVESLIKFDHADLLQWPSYMSPTTISTLAEYPLDYMMEKMLDIVNTGPGSLKGIYKTKGVVAHAVIESLFAPRNGQPCQANEIEQRINNEFDEQFKQAIESCGAILYLPENRLETELLKEQLRKCLDVLVGIIRNNNLKVTGCERQVKSDMGLLENNNGWDMKGFIDMTLEDENNYLVVFDFKWTSSKHYRDSLAANRSTQLELYRAMLTAEMHDTVERTAYFIMPKGVLYSKEIFKGSHCIQMQPENRDDIVKQLKNSFLYRKKQLDDGTVEVGEGFPLADLDYYNDTESEHLFPLSNDDGQLKKNIFSNYTLFKRVKEEKQ